MGIGKKSRKLLLIPPASGLLLSSVIVGNTHGKLAEIDLRQGEWTRELSGRGKDREEGQDFPLRWCSGASMPSFRCQIARVQILVSPKAV